MKSTGIIRKIDELGRIVIPIEIRRSLGIQEKDAIDIYVSDTSIILKKHLTPTTCHITGKDSDENISLADGKIVLSPEIAKNLLQEINEKIQ